MGQWRGDPPALRVNPRKSFTVKELRGAGGPRVATR